MTNYLYKFNNAKTENIKKAIKFYETALTLQETELITHDYVTSKLEEFQFIIEINELEKEIEKEEEKIAKEKEKLEKEKAKEKKKAEAKAKKEAKQTDN